MQIRQECEKNGHPMPRRVFIQADNTCKENKNCYVLAALSYLVARCGFDEVQLNFMMVGHTHTDIDRIFGYIYQALQK